jgi:hypothetical protein
VEKKVGIIKEKQKYYALWLVNYTCKMSEVIWGTDIENIMMLENVVRSCGSYFFFFISHKMCELWYVLLCII